MIKTSFNVIGNAALFLLLAVVAYGLASNYDVNIFLFIFLFLPFPINYYLAITKGKHESMTMLLTLVFSWVVTLILFFLPEKEAKPKNKGDN
jgi:hypothetical protein